MRAERLRSGKAMRIVHRGEERHRGTNTGNLAPGSAQLPSADELDQQPVQLAILISQHLPACQHAFGRHLEQRISGSQLADTVDKRAALDALTGHQPEHLE